ncbi:MAG: hypothetical protein COV70_01570 [Parcubacteria group bacterium CG11_big_fil_rev_8_21_14_0_20_39_22]|nr:MAG: hypothetical protein COV70_01570 [Parcubacteria group bacterium CG11_big_fil_rev_8_21_14_0_20_39_22]
MKKALVVLSALAFGLVVINHFNNPPSYNKVSRAAVAKVTQTTSAPPPVAEEQEIRVQFTEVQMGFVSPEDWKNLEPTTNR